MATALALKQSRKEKMKRPNSKNASHSKWKDLRKTYYDYVV